MKPKWPGLVKVFCWAIVYVVLYAVLYNGNKNLIGHFNDTLQKTIPIYTLLIFTMAYNTILGNNDHRRINLLGTRIPYSKLAGIVFLMSDTILGLTEISGLLGPNIIPEDISSFFILFTYYFAQYLFAKYAIEK